jgi:proteasome accessory factor B
MKKIFGWLQDGMYPNCSSMARDLEVSVKTAARDLDCLRDEWDLPIDYDDKRHGFFFSKKVEHVPWVPVTEAELFAVCISSKVLELYHGMPFQKPLELAFAKMTRSLDDDEKYMLKNLDLAFSFRPVAPEEADVTLLELVTRSVAEGRGLKFEYRKPGDKCKEVRQVHPYHVLSYDGRMYLLAHDTVRCEIRTFLLGRMMDVKATSDRFVRPKEFDPKKELSSSLGVMKGNGDYQVVIEMDAWLTDILRGRRLHPSQVVEEPPGGDGSRLRLRLSCLEEIEQYVRSWGTHCTVLEPQELRQRLMKTGRELWERYAAEGGPKL